MTDSFAGGALLSCPKGLTRVRMVPCNFPPVGGGEGCVPFTKEGVGMLFIKKLSRQGKVSCFFSTVGKLRGSLRIAIMNDKGVGGYGILGGTLSGIGCVPSLPRRRVLTLVTTRSLFVFPSLFRKFKLMVARTVSRNAPIVAARHAYNPRVVGRNRGK